MKSTTIKFVFLLSLIHLSFGIKILCVFPTPTHGANNVYKALSKELTHRGFELVILTTEPTMFDQKSELVKTINLGEISHKIWGKKFITRDIRRTMRTDDFSYYDIMLDITAEQMKSEEVTKFINTNTDTFDLLLVESYIPTWYAFAEKFNIPVVAISPESPKMQDLEMFGVPTHPYLYPDNSMFIRHDVENLGFFDRFSLFFNYFDNCRTFNKVYLPRFEMIAKKYFGNEIDLKRIRKTVSVMIANVHPIMSGVRPTVPGLVYTGNLHVGHYKELPEWLLNFVDTADNGIVLFSLGSNVMSQYLPIDKIKIFTDAFKELPYKFLWKWENKKLPDHPDNVLIYDWATQEDILANLKTVAFITSGGRHSVDEAVHYQVPMVGIPIFGEHKYNMAKVVQLGLGVQLDFNTMTKESLKNAIVDVVNNQTYKNHLVEVFTLMDDAPITSMENAMWWIDYTIRHGNVNHLKHKHEFLSGFTYYFLDIITFIAVIVIIILALVGVCLFKIKGAVFKRRSSFSHYHDPKKMT